MGAFEGLSNYFEQPLYEYAVNLGYNDSNIFILKGDIYGLRNQFENIYQNLLSCQHHSDRRTPMEYGQDLIASWIFEDYFINEMRNQDFDIELSGADRQRIILPNQRTSTSSDYIIRKHDGYEITMELVNDYTGFWYRNHKLHLRDNKYQQLQRKQSLLLAIALSSQIQKYAVFDFRDNIPAVMIPSHKAYGGKPAYELTIDESSLYDFSFEHVKHTLLEKLGG